MDAYYWRKNTNMGYLSVNGLSTVPSTESSSGHSKWQIMWWPLLSLEVLIYSSYSILVHLCMVEGRVPFRSSSVVLCTEVMKIVLSAGMIWPDLYSGRVKLPGVASCASFMVPATLYSINNNLGVYMQSHMDPTTYQVLGNLKVVTTAVLYRIIIKRTLKGQQWFALGLLTVAGMLDSYSGFRSKGGNWTGQIHVTLTGLVMISVYCWISGFAGVYTEYILKENYQTSLHLQNILLYMFGILCNGGAWLVQESQADEMSGLFDGFTFYTWLIVVTQACNGLIMSVIMKHSSNITRLFIISCAMLLTTVMSVIILDLDLSLQFIAAFVLVVIALYLYHGNGTDIVSEVVPCIVNTYEKYKNVVVEVVDGIP